MSFDLRAILVLATTAVFYLTLLPAKWRQPFLLVGSVVGLFWLQPPLPPRFAGFWLPALTVGLVVWAWWVTQAQNEDGEENAGGLRRLGGAL